MNGLHGVHAQQTSHAASMVSSFVCTEQSRPGPHIQCCLASAPLPVSKFARTAKHSTCCTGYVQLPPPLFFQPHHSLPCACVRPCSVVSCSNGAPSTLMSRPLGDHICPNSVLALSFVVTRSCDMQRYVVTVSGTGPDCTASVAKGGTPVTGGNNINLPAGVGAVVEICAQGESSHRFTCASAAACCSAGQCFPAAL